MRGIYWGFFLSIYPAIHLSIHSRHKTYISSLPSNILFNHSYINISILCPYKLISWASIFLTTLPALPQFYPYICSSVYAFKENLVWTIFHCLVSYVRLLSFSSILHQFISPAVWQYVIKLMWHFNWGNISLLSRRQ